jgi:hypothetical protein
MLLLELAAQGVRGFSPSVRVALQRGYVCLEAPGPSPAPLTELLAALFYPDGRGADVVLRAADAPVGRAGVAVSVTAGEVWRAVRELGGAGALQRLNAQTNQFEVVTQDPTEVVQLLRSRVGVPSRAVFEQLFIFNDGQFQARRPRRAASTMVMGAAVKPPPAEVRSAVDGAPAAARVAELERELEVARGVARRQLRQDELQAELFQVEERVRSHEALRARLVAARAELSRAPSPKSLSLPDDIVERVQRQVAETRRFDEALERLSSERDAALAGRGGRVAPLIRDRRFVGSVVAGVGLLIGAACLDGGLRRLALASIPCFSFATLLALRWIEDLQRQRNDAARAEVFAAREKKLTDEYSLSNAVVAAAFEKTGAVGPDDFIGIMGRREALQPQVAALELEFAEAEAEPDVARLPADVERLRGELQQLTRQLEAESQGYVREPREIERDLAQLTAARAAPSMAPPPAAPPPGMDTGSDEPLAGALSLASSLLGADVPSTWRAVRERAGQYFTAFTDGQFQRVDLDHEGHATAQTAGRTVPAAALSSGDLDLLVLSVRLALVERAVAQAPVPLIIEGALTGVIDASKRPLLGRMLRHLGTLTQVLQVTGAGQGAPEADAVVAI